MLGTEGWPVTLVDVRLSCPPVFKAEKIEPPQAELLRKFGLLENLVANAGRIREVRSYFDGRLFQTISEEQYGMFYSDMVQAIRALLPETVEFKLGRVVRIENSNDVQSVTLDGGEELTRGWWCWLAG
jgi:2-polyprenyl-6-methoxyphenol hydroxylase-like FAD-dependent oxidoreductase